MAPTSSSSSPVGPVPTSPLPSSISKESGPEASRLQVNLPLENAIRRLTDNDPSLTILNLEKMGINAADTARLAAGLKSNSALSSLNLNENDLKAEGVRCLAEVL